MEELFYEYYSKENFRRILESSEHKTNLLKFQAIIFVS